jgi:hypothetical protein
MGDETKIAAGAVDPDGHDLIAPLQTVLRKISVLPEEGDAARVGALAGTPDSVAIIEAGATTFSKAGVTAIAALGGGGVILAAVQGFWNGQRDAMRIVLVSCFTAFLVALVVALAVIIAADVRSRARASVAQYDARSAVTVEYLRAVQSLALGAHREAPAAPVPAGLMEQPTSDWVKILGALATTVLERATVPAGNGH